MEKKIADMPGGLGTGKDLQNTAFCNFVIESLPVGVVTVNPQRMITSFNPWAETLTGYSEKEALGRYCGDLLQGGMCKLHCPLKTVIYRRQPVLQTETTIKNKAGETIPVRMHTAALLDKEGGLIGAVEAFQDISSLKAMEREKDNIISMFAHDMKSSLSIIGGFSLRLHKKAGDLNEEKQGDYLGIIQKEVNRLDSLITDFLEFARLQTGKLKLNFEATSLDRDLIELFDAYQARAMQSGIKLELRNEKSLPVIEADPKRLRRAFTNLLDNAFKFSTRGGTITLSTKETDQESGPWGMSRAEFGGGVDRLRVLHHENPCRDGGLIWLSPYAGRFIMELEEIKKAIEALTEEEKREFFSEIVPEICDESITKEGCRMIFEKKLSGSRYLESFDELHETQKKQ